MCITSFRGNPTVGPTLRTSRSRGRRTNPLRSDLRRARWVRRSAGEGRSQLEQVVGGADEAPFAVHGLHSPPGEGSIATVGLDVAEDGLDDDFASPEAIS